MSIFRKKKKGQGIRIVDPDVILSYIPGTVLGLIGVWTALSSIPGKNPRGFVTAGICIATSSLFNYLSKRRSNRVRQKYENLIEEIEAGGGLTGALLSRVASDNDLEVIIKRVSRARGWDLNFAMEKYNKDKEIYNENSQKVLSTIYS